MDLARETAEIKRHPFGEIPSTITLGDRFPYMAITSRRSEGKQVHIELIDRPRNIIHIFEYSSLITGDINEHR